MGQAVVVLPDPLETPPPPTRLAATDDLLSQIAGDEIDRLLAEAEEGRPPASPPFTKADTPPAAAAEAPAAGRTPSDSPPDRPEPPHAVESVELSESAQIDALLTQVDRDTSPAVLPASAEVLPAVVAPVAILHERSPSSAADAGSSEVGPPTHGLSAGVPAALAAHGVSTPAPNAQGDASSLLQSPESGPEPLMSAAERDALDLPSLDAATEHATAADARAATPGRPNVVIRLLELLNAPLASVPDAARDALGKVAVITLVNAVGVIVYVLFFRK